MPIGNEIPDLKLTRLTKLMSRFTMPPSLLLMNMFGTDKWDSDNIEWESEIGNRGMTPFVAPDAPSPTASPIGVGMNKAAAAYWKEKMLFTESFLNNLREPGNKAKYQKAKKTLAKNMRQLSNRNQRRKEWMFAKMLCDGTIDYLDKSGVKTYVDYAIPSDNQETLAANRKWDTGTSRNITEDIFDAKLTMQNTIGATLDYAIFPSEVLKLLVFDDTILSLLQKSAYGDGDLHRNPTRVLGDLLGITNMVVYDEQYQIRGWLTSAVTADTTTSISVDDAVDFEVGGTLTFYDTSAKTKESETISAVSETGSTVTVSTAPSTSYKAQEDYVYMTKKFLPTNKFTMFASNVQGEKIAEFAEAPFGLNRGWGMMLDQWEVKDPDGVYIRSQNKGLPVLYNEDAIFQYTVTD